MSYRRLGLGFVVAVVGVMGFASSAHGANPGFLIGGSPVGALSASVGAEQVGAAFLLVPALNLEIRCQQFTVQEGKIESNIVAKTKILHEECEPLEMAGLGVFDDCHIVASAIDQKLHIAVSATFLPAEILTTNAPALLAENVVAIVTIASPTEECVLPEKNTVKGEVCVVIGNNNTVRPLRFSSNTIQVTCKPRTTLEGLNNELPTQTGSNFKDELRYGAQTASLDSTAHLFLTGAHAGKTLGVSLY